MKPTKQDIKRDKLFREWVRTQKCHRCGGYAEYLDDGRKLNHAAHYNTAANSGKATKALMSCIPLCFNCHILIQHQKGVSAIMSKDEWAAAVKTYVTRFLKEVCV